MCFIRPHNQNVFFHPFRIIDAVEIVCTVRNNLQFRSSKDKQQVQLSPSLTTQRPSEMSTMNDAAIAKKLQALEISEEQRRRENLRLQDEEVARQLAQPFIHEEKNSSSPSQNQSQNNLLIHAGQKARIYKFNHIT